MWQSFSGQFHQCVAGWGRRFGFRCFGAAEELFVVCVVVDVGGGDVVGRCGRLVGGHGRRTMMRREAALFLRMIPRWSEGTLPLNLPVDVLVSVSRSEMARLVSETQYLAVCDYNGNHLLALASAFLTAGLVPRASRRDAEF